MKRNLRQMDTREMHMEILAIIPARCGSKSIKDKNIRLLDGKPMIAYSIEHAQKSKFIGRVIVSTDSEKYAAIAREFGAETPFIRPAEISDDSSLDIEVFQHALKYLKDNENYLPEIVVHLRPTYPIRRAEDIDNMIMMLINDLSADSVRCIAPVKETPYKMWRCRADGVLSPLLSDIPEAYNMPRQELPQIYSQNACIDVIRADVIAKGSMSGRKILGYPMPDNFDIDTDEDFERAERFLKLCANR